MFTLFQTVAEKLSDVFLISAPDQNLAGKKVNERDREHIAQNAHRIGTQHRQIHLQRHRHRAPKFNQRDHGDKKAEDIFFQHQTFTFTVFPAHCSIYSSPSQRKSSVQFLIFGLLPENIFILSLDGGQIQE